MKEWSRTSRFQITGSTLSRSFDDQVALVNMITKRFHLLNPTATLIWNSISAGNSIEEVERQLSTQFQVEPAEISKSMNALITALRSEKFIELRP